eukprot:gnl/TRDRNA2_/TRDRNA2_164301_c4_seq3.p1 gnl/TRDRNA2_/TRDRNA2_164301_c4~~gnl/TRDRNA2_/TRDRNA2_164301_c4_seq3.p1  ORF type:complete len:785 (+),score=143.12 gnl/TRDRNA2_/TRDRNA2_164301_c4_seq3:312-2357(+)
MPRSAAALFASTSADQDPRDMGYNGITSMVSTSGELNGALSFHVVGQGKFRLRSVWTEPQELDTEEAKRIISLKMQSQLTKMRSKSKQDLDGDAAEIENAIKSRMVLFPGSTWRLLWDLCGLLFIGWDIFAIPLRVFDRVFDPSESPAFNTMGWATLLFWSVDLISSFFTGYVEKGVTVMDGKRIAIHYLKTWFIVDCLIVVPDWVTRIMNFNDDEEGGTDSSPVRLLRILRLLRVLRLLRLLKLDRIWAGIYDHIGSEFVSVLMKILKLIVLLLVVNHLIGCTWWWIGDMAFDNKKPNWIEVNGFDHKGFEYCYISSMHWSLTQFTPASMEVTPENVFERCFAVLVLVFAMVVFSSFVSRITAATSSLREAKQKETREFFLLRRFLRESRISKRLSLRLQRYAEYVKEQQAMRVSRQDVKLLATLSTPLLNELQYELYSRHLSSHAFFRYLHINHLGSAIKLCASALFEVPLAGGDMAFFGGEHATGMIYVVEGDMLYKRRKQPPCQVEMGSWLCEAVLWTDWSHCGDLKAIRETNLIAIDPYQFTQVMSRSPGAWRKASRYALAYCRKLTGCNKVELTDMQLPKFRPELMLMEAKTASQFFETPVGSFNMGGNNDTFWQSLLKRLLGCCRAEQHDDDDQDEDNLLGSWAVSALEEIKETEDGRARDEESGSSEEDSNAG